VDALFASGDVERDVQKREAIYKQAQLIILRDAAAAMLTQTAQQSLITTKYHGLELNPSWAYFFQPVGNDWANVTVSP
jgi:ABC-type transport system substrate-binding protein